MNIPKNSPPVDHVTASVIQGALENIAIEIIVIMRLLVTAANIIAKVTSAAERGASKVSMILPCIFPTINEEDE